MNNNKLLISSVVEIVLGAVLLFLNFTGAADEYWGGMSTALIVVGALQLIKRIKYRTNAAYREAVDVSHSDERNKYLSMKAWSWSGYLFVLIAAAASIVLKIAGYDELVSVTAGSVCLIMVLYWISYMVLSRKY